MSNSLYNIEKEYIDLMNEIELMEGEITPEIENQLIINESQLKGKSIAYLSVIKQKKLKVKLAEETANHANKIKLKELKDIERLENSLLNAVNLYGNFESGLHKFGTRKSTTVEIENEDLIPMEYKVKKVKIKVDKMKIKQDLKNGLEIKGCSLSDNLNLKID